MRVKSYSFIHRCGSALGLLAMLLISLGALASQLVQPAEPAWMSELACGEHAEQQHDHSGHAEVWAKCGYCTLLLHSPATVAGCVRLNTAPQPLLRLQVPTVLGEGSPAIFPGARCRAPPVYS